MSKFMFHNSYLMIHNHLQPHHFLIAAQCSPRIWPLFCKQGSKPLVMQEDTAPTSFHLLGEDLKHYEIKKQTNKHHYWFFCCLYLSCQHPRLLCVLLIHSCQHARSTPISIIRKDALRTMSSRLGKLHSALAGWKHNITETDLHQHLGDLIVKIQVGCLNILPFFFPLHIFSQPNCRQITSQRIW